MSGTNHDKIIAGFKALNKSSMMYAKSILVAKVVRVDNDNLVQCEADGLEIPDVQLRPIATGSNKAVLVIPKKNSIVLIGSIEGRQEFIVLSVAEAEKVLMKVGDMTLDVLSKVINLNGDQFDGLVKVNELKENLKSLKQYVEALKLATSNGLNAVGVGVSANGGTAKAAFETSMSGKIITIKEMENTNVKHG